MPSINNALKRTETLVKTAQEASRVLSKPSNEVIAREVGPRLAPSAENLRAYSGVIMRNLYTNTETLARRFEYKSPAELEKAMESISGSSIKYETLDSALSMNRITDKELDKYISEKCCDYSFADLATDPSFSKELLLAGLIKDLQAHSFIKNHPVFEPYHLNLSETSQIESILHEGALQVDKKKVGTVDFSKIQEILKSKNPELYETLGGSEMFTEQTINKGTKYERTFIPARDSLLTLQDNVCGVNSIRHVLDGSDMMKTLDFKVNGETKSFLYKDALNVSGNIPRITNNTMVDLIKSNFITLDLIKSPEFKKLLADNPEIKAVVDSRKHTIKNPDLLVHGDIETDITFWDLAKKLEKEGASSLNSYEVHTLTDTLESAYKSLVKKHIDAQKQMFGKHTDEVEKAFYATDTSELIKSLEPKTKKMYGVIKGMKETLVQKFGGTIDKETGLYAKDGIYFEDHFFMRMIDRDLANVTENETGKILTTDELVSRILDTAKNGIGKKASLPELQGNGLTLITNKENGKLFISTVMQ